MLSFLAESKNYFSLPGPCPVLPQSSTPIKQNISAGQRYRAMLHYNSKISIGETFGNQPDHEVMNCMALTFPHSSVSKIRFEDCDIYNGELSWTTHNDYNLSLTNLDQYSSCFNRSFIIEHVNLWMDENGDVLILRKCTNDVHSSHEELVVVYVNHEKVTPAKNGSFNGQYLDYVKKFTKNVLNFTELTVGDFDVNELSKTDLGCKTTCYNYCRNDPEKSKLNLTILWIVFALICVVVIIACLVIV